jgi:hypothetical protein
MAVGFVVGDEFLARLAQQHHVPELHRLLAAAPLEQFRVRLEDAIHPLGGRHLLALKLRPPGLIHHPLHRRQEPPPEPGPR